MIKYCIFDLDGTLLNTLPTILYYLNETLLAFGYPAATEEQCKSYVGDGARKLIERALFDRGETNGETVTRILDVYKQAYDSSPLYLTEPYDGIPELIDGLLARGIRMGVVSNKPDFAARSVVSSFFGDSFCRVVGAREGIPLKPSPDAPLTLLDEMGGTPSECAFVGDTSVDILTGKNMKARLSVGVLWGFRDGSELTSAGADATVNRPEEILSLIQQK